MAEFYAWAATGTVTQFNSWLEAFAQSSDQPAPATGRVVLAERVAEHMEFVLHQENGPDMTVSLSNAGLSLDNGHRVTVVWVAPEDKPQGNTYCMCVVNHTAATMARLFHNLPRLRGEPGLRTALAFGLLATLPALFAALAWQLAPRSQMFLDQGTLIMMTTTGAVLLFGLGALISRWVMDVRAQDDERKIWAAVSEALEQSGVDQYAMMPDR